MLFCRMTPKSMTAMLGGGSLPGGGVWMTGELGASAGAERGALGASCAGGARRAAPVGAPGGGLWAKAAVAVRRKIAVARLVLSIEWMPLVRSSCQRRRG